VIVEGLTQVVFSPALRFQRFSGLTNAKAHLTLLSTSPLNKTSHYGDDSC
jgi:hypothetical protein